MKKEENLISLREFCLKYKKSYQTMYARVKSEEDLQKIVYKKAGNRTLCVNEEEFKKAIFPAVSVYSLYEEKRAKKAKKQNDSNVEKKPE